MSATVIVSSQNTDNTYEITIKNRDRAGWNRVYVFNAPEPDFAFPGGATGLDPKVDAECARWNREQAKIMRKLAVDALVSWTGDDTVPKMKFSAKAGCVCSCSPGFITDDRHGLDIFITVKLTNDTN